MSAKTFEYRLEGMNCGSCVKHIETALRAIDGVNQTQIDLKQKTATVVTDESITSDELIKAIEQAGYEPTAI